MANRAKNGRLARATVFLLIASLLIFSSPPIARADNNAINKAQDELQALKALVDKLDAALSQADEDYNQAAERLKETQAAQAKTQSLLAQARQDLDAAQQRLMNRLVDIYKTGNAGMLDALLGADSFSDLMGRFEELGRVGAQDNALVEQVNSYVKQVADRQAELAQQAKEEQTRIAQLAEAKQKVADRLSAQSKALKGKETQLAELKRQEAARQAALAAAAKERAAKAAAAAAAQAAAEAAAKTAAQKAAKENAAKEAAMTTTQPPEGPAAADTTPTTSPPDTQADTPTEAPAEPPPTKPGNDASTSASGTRAKVVDLALGYLGAPYVWAGASPKGFDCSGLVTYVYAKVGVSLPHSAAMQYQRGTHVSRDELLPGDLVFFYSPIHHVGIYIGDGQMVNSRGGGVQIDEAFWSSYVGATRIID